MRSFVKIKPSRNGKITLSFIEIGKSCLNREFFTSLICLLMLFAKIKFSRKFPNLQNVLPKDRTFFLLSEIVKRVSDASGVHIPISDKSCRSSLDLFNLLFLVTLVWTPDCKVVAKVGSCHGEVSLGLVFFARLSQVATQET